MSENSGSGLHKFHCISVISWRWICCTLGDKKRATYSVDKQRGRNHMVV